MSRVTLAPRSSCTDALPLSTSFSAASTGGFTTLLPPTPGEKGRWFTIHRPIGAPKSSQLAAQDQQTGAEEEPETPRRRNRLQMHRIVRLPSLPPSTSIGSSRVTFNDVDWSDDSVDKKEVTIMYDKDAQEMHLIERKPGGVEDGEWTLAAPPVTLDSLAQMQYTGALMELARDQGLLDGERWDRLSLLYKLKQGVDTFDLATNLSRGLRFATYPLQQTRRVTAELRLHMSLANPADKTKPHAFRPTATIFPTHAPDVFAARLAGQMRKNKAVEDILQRNDPNDPPELKDFTEDGGMEVLPYISTVGATPAEEGWEIDVSTPNRDANPPTATPPFPDAPSDSASQSSSSSDISAPSSSPASKPSEALILRSASPETFRFWSFGLRQDMSFLPRPLSWAGGYYSAWTGEQVRDKMPVLWMWARSRGHWKEIPEK
ncbi:hypothetical protein FRC00_009266, partial [Tulasnella sp. 408]